MKLFKLSIPDKARFHFGAADRSLEGHFSSDRLFSAIINKAALLYPDEKVEEIISCFKNEKIFISSIFYGIDFYDTKEENPVKTIYFLPLPFARIFSPENEKKEQWIRKKIKSIKYISLDACNSLFPTWNPEGNYFDFDLTGLYIIGEKFACTKKDFQDLNFKEHQHKMLENTKFMKVVSRPRVRVNRFHQRSENIYYQEDLELSFQQIGNILLKPFMYFLVKGELSKEIRACLALLSEDGLGGMRTHGSGYFIGIEECPEHDFEFLFDEGKYFINLSTLFPQRGDVDHLLSYKLNKKNGYIYSMGKQPYRKKTVRIIEEGAIFKKPVRGQVLDVTPGPFKKHRVLLYGKPLLINFGGGKK